MLGSDMLVIGRRTEEGQEPVRRREPANLHTHRVVYLLSRNQSLPLATRAGRENDRPPLSNCMQRPDNEVWRDIYFWIRRRQGRC